MRFELPFSKSIYRMEPQLCRLSSSDILHTFHSNLQGMLCCNRSRVLPMKNREAFMQKKEKKMDHWIGSIFRIVPN